MTTQNTDVLYRTISFRNDTVWGYIVMHHIAMQYVAPSAPADGVDSEINFFFTSEAVQIQGKGLRVLWDKLVMELPETISVGTFRTEMGSYEITKMGIVRPGPPKA